MESNALKINQFLMQIAAMFHLRKKNTDMVRRFSTIRRVFKRSIVLWNLLKLLWNSEYFSRKLSKIPGDVYGQTPSERLSKRLKEDPKVFH